jgi:hypothetical protein
VPKAGSGAGFTTAVVAYPMASRFADTVRFIGSTTITRLIRRM